MAEYAVGANPMYQPVPATLDLPKLDHEIIAFWRANNTFQKSWQATEQGQQWTFYEGPPTANGQPGTHHIEARVFKDVFPRFKTMQGFRVDRKAGWDCHGLPVELAVEAELGIDHKSQIEEYGVAAFNEKCRESVGRNVGKFAELTERMGYWVDLDAAYWTLAPEYIDSEWWALKTIFDKGLLVEDYRVTPYCPHDETALSDHEVSQGYEDLSDPSVFVRMPLTSGSWADKGAALLVWTTTPWTLVSNTAVAAHPEVTYQLVGNGIEFLVIAEPLFGKLFGDDLDAAGNPRWQVHDTIKGADMRGWTYQRPFTWLSFDKPANFVVTAEYVTTEDGTGLVHQAPAFGAEDMAVGREYGLPVVNPVRKDGTFEQWLPLIGGQFFKEADDALVADLRERGLLFKLLPYEHPYPFCWRCHSPLIYYAQPSWYIRTTQRRAELLRENENTKWYPDTIKWGRYGDWLNNNVDWALSRTRYWGTPLPIWRNDADPKLLYCVGSRAELAELAGDASVANMDPHRPFVDDVTFTLPGVTGVFRRVPEVIDAWFDSGSMPFAQWGYPWVEGSVEAFESHFPADFIAEAIDQTRGWFYTLMAVSTLVFERSSYQNVLCLGHILAEDGRKMSKHLGNILLPMPLLDDNGADAVRWFMACAGSPWSARRVGNNTLQEVVRKVLLTYWNTVSFQALYARANGWTPWPTKAEHVLDRWLTSATQQLVLDVSAALDNFDTQRYGQLLSAFIDDLSNWYVRRSRRRFWDGDPNALWTLHTTLDTLTRLLAPMVPFITESVWQSLFVATDSAASESVHLASWPIANANLIDTELNNAMGITRRLVELGRAARAEAKVKTRQPLSRALISSTSYEQLNVELLAEICAELNVGEVSTFAAAGDLVDISVKGNFRNLGRRFAQNTPAIAAAIAAADAAALSAALSATGVAEVDVPTVARITISADDVIVTERPREGWAVLGDQGDTIALDLELTPELVAAGIAREIVRLIQDARKTSGFDVSDRIKLTWKATDEAAAAFRTHTALIASEVLAVEITEVAALSDESASFGDKDLGIEFMLERVYRHQCSSQVCVS
ncbi:MAG: isoleucine--tRNA ligase [Propionibacteriaceae bacterium]|jgi:isoleucyl-tRNA synthetase|nr:isoleucine--tRNA ligase [Propionibacteriaceae bacterium]